MARRTGLRAVTWGRERIRGFERAEVPGVEGIDFVICGHTPVDDPLWIGNVAYIDTGAYSRKGRMTLATLDELLTFRGGKT